MVALVRLNSASSRRVRCRLILEFPYVLTIESGGDFRLLPSAFFDEPPAFLAAALVRSASKVFRSSSSFPSLVLKELAQAAPDYRVAGVRSGP